MTRTSPVSGTSKSTDKTIDKSAALCDSAIEGGPRADIHLGAIVENYRAIAKFSGNAETGAVVKANAYGHGTEQVAQALSAAGCRTFFVAYEEEGQTVRDAVGPDAIIYVFHSLLGAGLDRYHTSDLRPVLNSVEDVASWVDATRQPFALKVDTGMNRLGMRAEDVGAARIALGQRKPDYVVSHLACADDDTAEKNRNQLDRFHEVTAVFPNVKRSLSATAGIWLGADFHFDLVRPGIGLFGGGPKPPRRTKLSAGMTLSAQVLSVFRVAAGESTGYGATRTFDRSAVLATLSIGYADGFPRSASNSGMVMIGGCKCPIVGRVSMDMITVDVSKVPESAGLLGQRAEIFGPNLRLETQANAAGTLGYELTSGLGSRISRRWI